jgi:hypothetical protein
LSVDGVRLRSAEFLGGRLKLEEVWGRCGQDRRLVDSSALEVPSGICCVNSGVEPVGDSFAVAVSVENLTVAGDLGRILIRCRFEGTLFKGSVVFDSGSWFSVGLAKGHGPDEFPPL